jgi:hypothetical protein
MKKNYKPKKYNAAEMKRVGVTITSESSVHLRCDACGQSWSPNLLSGGRLPKNYWKCPTGCN